MFYVFNHNSSYLKAIEKKKNVLNMEPDLFAWLMLVRKTNTRGNKITSIHNWNLSINTLKYRKTVKSNFQVEDRLKLRWQSL